MLTTLFSLRDQDIFSDLDVYFAQFIATLAERQDDSLLLAAALVSCLTAQGHVCVDLAVYANQPFPLVAEVGLTPVHCPDLTQWLSSLQNCTVVGQPGEYKPLILQENRLYLYRYWQYEHLLVEQIRHRIQAKREDVDHTILQASIARLFPQAEKNDKQRLAAETAVLRNFCIISGGPGTGKTFTILKILVSLLEQNINQRIALTAPTGKAAARLQTMINKAKMQLACAPAIKAAIPQETYTIHRLLGSLPNSPYFRHNASNLLLYDVVIVDEASMVDLALMTKLAQALPLQTRWILLGDKDQLASVEAGTVLGDMCAVSVPTVQSNIVLLERNYRFARSSGIGMLAQTVKQGQSESALQLIKSGTYTDIQWNNIGTPEELTRKLTPDILNHFVPYLHGGKQPEEIITTFEQFRILCALRRGPFGVVAINRLVEYILNNKGLIQSKFRWYHGRPIMITRNDYALKLFNGDIGIILWNSAHRELQAFFPALDGKSLRTFFPNRLPEHETVYAMTIHKSQGSEFDNVLMLLPDQFSPILSRELIYTGITRAKQNLSVWGTESGFKESINQRIKRVSGLQEALQSV